MNELTFKVTMDNHPDLSRVIALKGNQTFEDLHNAILRSVDFDNTQLASFYICDDDWVKKLEITLIDMNAEDSELTPVMAEVKLSDYLSQNGQKLIYEYDFVKMWRFFVEIISIKASSPKIKYPIVIESHGEAPSQYSENDEFGSFDSDEDTALIEELRRKNFDLLHGGEDEQEEPWDEDLEEEGSDDYEKDYPDDDY